MPDAMTPGEIAAKLTKAQREELLSIALADTPEPCCLHYRPFMKLWDRELVTRANGRWRGDYFVATDLGRAVAALLAAQAKEGHDAE